MLQLADRLFRLPHAVGGGVHLIAQEVRILAVDGHLGERLDLALDAIQLEADELGVLLRALEVVEPQLAHRHAVLQRLGHALVGRLLRRLEALAQAVEARRHLLLVHRPQEAIERRLGHEQPEKQPEQPIEAWRRHAVARRRLIARRAADAGRDAAHLAAARVQPFEAIARVGLQAAQQARERRRGHGGGRQRTLLLTVDLRVDGGAEPRHGREPGEVGQLAGADERNQDVGHRRQRGCRRPAEKQQQVPAEEKRLRQVAAESRGPLVSHRPPASTTGACR